jgi:Skp family chaperone for outer membrane proteins
MPKRTSMNVLVLSAALLIGAGPYIVKAAVNAAGRQPESIVANVDMQRVFNESDAKKAVEQKLTEYGATLGKRFDEVSRTQYLTPDEISDYSAKLNIEKPTDADTKRIADIKAASQQRAEEYQRLSALKQPTAKDAARLQELDTMQRQRPLFQDRLQKLYQQAVDEEEQKQMRAGLAEVRGIVGKMAKEQGFTEVYDVTAMVYAPADLTDQAIRKVQKKK